MTRSVSLSPIDLVHRELSVIGDESILRHPSSADTVLTMHVCGIFWLEMTVEWLLS